MDFQKYLETLGTSEQRNDNIQKLLTPEKVIELFIECLNSSEFPHVDRTDYKGKLFTIVFHSTQALERWLQNKSSGSESSPIEFLSMPIGEAVNYYPSIDSVKICTTNPNFSCITVSTLLLMSIFGGQDTAISHSFTCFDTKYLKVEKV
jgi:hypothetical protein